MAKKIAKKDTKTNGKFVIPQKRRIEVWERPDGQFQWRLRAANGEIVTTAEPFTLKNNTKRAARAAFPKEKDLILVDLDLKRIKPLHEKIKREGLTGHAARIAQEQSKARKKAKAAKANGAEKPAAKKVSKPKPRPQPIGVTRSEQVAEV